MAPSTRHRACVSMCSGLVAPISLSICCWRSAAAHGWYGTLPSGGSTTRLGFFLLFPSLRAISSSMPPGTPDLRGCARRRSAGATSLDVRLTVSGSRPGPWRGSGGRLRHQWRGDERRGRQHRDRETRTKPSTFHGNLRAGDATTTRASGRDSTFPTRTRSTRIPAAARSSPAGDTAACSSSTAA